MNIQMKSLALVSSVALITACGGSSSGDSSTPAPENSVAISDTNARNLALDAYNSAFVIFSGALESTNNTSANTASNSQSSSSSSSSRSISSFKLLISGDRSETFANKTTELTTNCSGGGSIVVTEVDNEPEGQINSGDSYTVAYTNCIEGLSTTNGSASFTFNNIADTSATVTFSFNNFSTVTPDYSSNINGSMSMSYSENGATDTFSITSPSISMSYNGESVTLTNYSIVATETGTQQTLDIDYVLTTPEGTVTVVTDPVFQGSVFDDCPTLGTMTITGTNGSSASLNANTGNPNTLLLTINNGSSTTTETINCSDLN